VNEFWVWTWVFKADIHAEAWVGTLGLDILPSSRVSASETGWDTVRTSMTKPEVKGGEVGT